MTERNLCVESGCKGYCCEDIDLTATKFERHRLFPKAKRLNTIRELEMIKGKETGVFYTGYRNKMLGNSGVVIISINGPCPNRTPDGDCRKHSEREHAARRFKIGCEDCNAIREEHNLPPIYIEPVE